MKNKLKKLLLLSLSLTMAFSIAGCQKSDGKDEQKKFDEFINTQFIETMEDEYLNTHIFLEKPSTYKVDTSKIKVELGEVATDETIAKNLADLKATKKAFDEFDRDVLTDYQKETYDSFKFDLDLNLASNNDKFKYMGSAFTTLSGIHTQLPTLFADLTLRNEQDVKDLITLIGNTKTYIDGILKQTKEQASKGLLMVNLDSVKEFCNKILKEGKNSSVLSSMNANIDKLKLDDTKSAQYKKQVEEAFTTSFLPAYENITKTMDALKSEKNNKEGLANLDNGKEFYKIMFKNATGSNRSIEDTKKLLEESATNSINKAITIARGNSDVYDKYFANKYKTNYKDFKSMLVDLESMINDDFPAVKKLSYQIQPLDKDIANNGVAAYFNLPAIDGTTPKQIRVNMQEGALKIDALDTFKTVAHEGLPGHMYQVSYVYENLNDPYRKVLASNSGFQEGFATYVELYSLKYVKGLDAAVAELDQAMSVYQNALTSLMDIGIHYEGWSLEDTKKFMTANNLNEEVADKIYNQLQENPTSFLSYYVGYTEIETLKEKAMNQLGKKFNEKDFHTALLKAGSVPFDAIIENINDYINATK